MAAKAAPWERTGRSRATRTLAFVAALRKKGSAASVPHSTIHRREKAAQLVRLPRIIKTLPPRKKSLLK